MDPPRLVCHTCSIWHRSLQLMSAVLVQSLRARCWALLNVICFYCSGFQGCPVFLHNQLLRADWGPHSGQQECILGDYCKCLISIMSQVMTLVPSVSPSSHSITSSSQTNQLTLCFWSTGLPYGSFCPKMALLQQHPCGAGNQAAETAGEELILCPVKVKWTL